MNPSTSTRALPPRGRTRDERSSGPPNPNLVPGTLTSLWTETPVLNPPTSTRVLSPRERTRVGGCRGPPDPGVGSESVDVGTDPPVPRMDEAPRPLGSMRRADVGLKIVAGEAYPSTPEVDVGVPSCSRDRGRMVTSVTPSLSIPETGSSVSVLHVSTLTWVRTPEGQVRRVAT